MAATAHPDDAPLQAASARSCPLPFLRAAQQDAHLTRAHLCEQLRLFLFVVRVMNERDLAGRHAVPISLSRTSAYTLNAAACTAATPSVMHLIFFSAFGVDRSQNTSCVPLVDANSCQSRNTSSTEALTFAARLIRQKRIDEPLVQRQLAAIVCNFQHIVLAGVYVSVPHRLGALAQFSHHFPLDVCGLYHNIFSAPPPAQANSAYPLSGCPPPRATAPSAPANCRTGRKPRAHPVSVPPASAPPM